MDKLPVTKQYLELIFSLNKLHNNKGFQMLNPILYGNAISL